MNGLELYEIHYHFQFIYIKKEYYHKLFLQTTIGITQRMCYNVHHERLIRSQETIGFQRIHTTKK